MWKIRIEVLGPHEMEGTDLTENQEQFVETSAACEKQMSKSVRDVNYLHSAGAPIVGARRSVAILSDPPVLLSGCIDPKLGAFATQNFNSSDPYFD
ncbi:hypothetical protein LguiB_025537 [Lonicera macranthoides]